MMNLDLFDFLKRKAWLLAIEKHKLQKYDSEKYIEHIKRVYYRVATLIPDSETKPTMEIVAIIHDIVEDADYSFEEVEEVFGKEIRIAVEHITRDKSKETYFEYIERARKNIIAKNVKICDILENLQHCYLNIGKHGSKISRYEKALILLSQEN